jgi:hypothetical protein
MSSIDWASGVGAAQGCAATIASRTYRLEITNISIKDQRLSQARIKQAGNVPIGEHRNKLPGAAPSAPACCLKTAKGFQGE